MGKIVAVWGKSGSGKSVLSTNLSCALAKRGLKIALIGANRFYGSIQHYFGMGINPDESLRTCFSEMVYSNIEKYFKACAMQKNLYVSSQSNYDDCLGYSKFSRDQVKRFLNLSGECFDIMVIECDDSIDDALSMLSLTHSELVLYVTRPTVQHAAFSNGFESLVKGLSLTDKMQVIVNYDKGYSDIATFLPFGSKHGYTVLPFCQMIEKSENNGRPIILSKHPDNPSKTFIGRINDLVDNIVNEGEHLKSSATKSRIQEGDAIDAVS
ncbi:MAG: AAA family ATPase [Synergistaceae bacterium]|nr:AAA family ATPase [Synergistaceae bacterium]